MLSYDPVYVIPEWKQWRIEYDGRLCDEAETIEEALRLGRIWARKLHRVLAVQSEEGLVKTAESGFVLTVIDEDDAQANLTPKQRSELQRKKARQFRETCETQLQHAAKVRDEMILQRTRLEQLRTALEQENMPIR